LPVSVNERELALPCPTSQNKNEQNAEKCGKIREDAEEVRKLKLSEEQQFSGMGLRRILRLMRFAPSRRAPCGAWSGKSEQQTVKKLRKTARINCRF
jgi:hypothetical protein